MGEVGGGEVGDETFIGVEGLDVEEGGDLFWDPVGPPAIAVDEAGEAGALRRELVVGGAGVLGVVFALEGVAKENDEAKGGVGHDGKVQVAARHLVDFVND